MNLNDYQDGAWKTALPQVRDNVHYMMYGLMSEAGEIAGKMAKLERQDYVREEMFAKLKPELGDMLWFLSGAARILGFTLEEIAQSNLDKLESRQARGKLQGDGDTR